MADSAKTTSIGMPKVLVLDEYCITAKQASCQRCQLACPQNAITVRAGSAPVIDQTKCNGCGICYGICDAFSSTRITMVDLHARIRRIAIAGDRVYLTCKENAFPGFKPASNVVVLPCLSMLSPEFLTLLLAENIRISICCDLRYCEDCDRACGIGGELFPRAIEIAEERTGEQILFSYRMPERKTLTEKYSDTEDAQDRRAAFTGFVSDAAQIASGKRRLRNSEVIADFYERRERSRAVARLNITDGVTLGDFSPQGRVKKTLFPKKRMTIEAISRKPEIAQRIPLAVSVTDEDVCTTSCDCITTCPTGARNTNDKGAIAVDELLCIGCGICVDACKQSACSIEEITAARLLALIPEK